MHNFSAFNKLLPIVLLLNGCNNILSDYEKESILPLSIDEDICAILSNNESVSPTVFLNSDSMTNKDLFDMHVSDTSSFVVLSNANVWNVAIDTTSYFMVNAPQEADTYFVALNASIELELFNINGDLVVPDNVKISTKNIAGCSAVKVRHSYAGFNGQYLARLHSTTQPSVGLVFVNSNRSPTANFSTSSTIAVVGDSITFNDQSQPGTYAIKSYTWTFGDNNSVSGEMSTTTHTYMDSGVFSPSLTVSDGYLVSRVIKSDFINIYGGGDQ
tara:strand:- start:2171 stop:2986 length:816 start_codon:yes stop_codon:yes gene_type:complete